MSVVRHFSTRQNIENLSVELLRECFDYAPEIGKVIWKVRPQQHFLTAGAWKRFNNRFAGKVAGNKEGTFVSIRVTILNAKYSLMAAHVAYKLSGKEIPENEILDHKNGDPFDNRLSNLRPCPQSKNAKNQRIRVTNTSGYTGIYKTPKGKWTANIWVDYGYKYLGTYATFEEAVAARKAGEAKYFGEFARR